jgi:hypothetical protein
VQVGQRRSEATLVTGMISEVPHLSQDFCVMGTDDQHHFVSIISFPHEFVPIEVGRDFDRGGARFRREVGQGSDGSGAGFRLEVGQPRIGLPRRKQVRAFLRAMALLSASSQSGTSAFPFPPFGAVRGPSSWQGSEAG